MAARMTDDERMDARDRARCRAEAKAVDRLDRQLDAADRLIGELCRNGQPVLYVWPAGGKYREGKRLELISHLIRNRYI